ncbi:unnamed protein product [Prunus brigantina]
MKYRLTKKEGGLQFNKYSRAPVNLAVMDFQASTQHHSGYNTSN